MSVLEIPREDRTVTFESSVLSLVLNKTTFLWALCLASVIPFVIGSLHYTGIIGYAAITSLISFLALVHVPMTLYLFSDSGIRSQVTVRPVVLMGVPCLLVATSVFMYLHFSADMGSATPQFLFYFLFATVAWQHWHFGKQNVGVFAFSRLATKSGPMRKFERALIVSGATCGVLVTYAMVGAAYKTQFSPDADLSAFETTMESVVSFGRYLQYAVTATSLAYVALNWRSLTLSSGLLLLIGANFFFPQYLHMDKPDYFFIFGYFLAAHGLQYLVFLFFHSVGFATVEAQKQPPSEAYVVNRLKRLGRICVGPAIFALAVLILGDLYTSGGFLAFNSIVDSGLNWVLGLDISELTVSKIGAGLITGILLSHFWLDSFFWRLKDKAPREWVRSRYDFIF